VLTPAPLADEKEKPEDVSESSVLPRQKHFLPTSRKQMLRDRIDEIQGQVHNLFSDPVMSNSEKLHRHGALIQAYREAYAELNKPIFAPPFSNEYLGPLPKESKPEESQKESYEQFLASLLAKAQEEEAEEEEKTANASRIMSKMMTPTSQKRQSPFSQASFHSSYSQPPFSHPPPKWPPRPIKQEELSDVDEEQVVTSTPKVQKSTPKPIPLKAIRQTSMAETRERRGPKPVERLSYSTPGVQRRGYGHENVIRKRFF